MTNREFCLARRKAEEPAFLRVLKALPQERLDYRPDPKARTAAEVAWLLAAEEAALVSLVDAGVVSWKEERPPALDQIVATYERSAAAADERLGRLDEPGWEKRARWVMDGGGVWEATLSEFFWGVLFDQVHHRGQLSTYLRPMGGRVPSIYGPSADDSGQ